MNARAGALAPPLAALAGLAALAAHPPVGWWPVSFLAPALLLASLWVDAASARQTGRRIRAFRLGTVAGAAWFAPLLSWLILPAGWLGWALLVALQAVWTGLLGVLLAWLLERPVLPLTAAVVWTGIDAWRGILPFNGFEWGALAYAHVDGSWLLPVARILGGRGITFLVVLIGVAGALTVRAALQALRREGLAGAEQALGGTTAPIAWLVGGLLASVLMTVEPPPEVGSIDVLAVQGDDVRRWEDGVADPDRAGRIAAALHDETVAAVVRDGRPDLTIWPESGVDRDPWSSRGQPLGELAGQAAGVAGQLLTGVTLDGPNPAANRYVAALLLEDGLYEVDRYVKRRLVPFGEYIPFRPLFAWYPPLDQVARDTLDGDGPQVVEVASGIRAAVVICFETLFTHIVRGNVLAGEEPAQIVLTLTNDASFADSAEPAQHLAQSRLRAVETGRWVVHAALSGSSAFVDPSGGTHQDTELFTVDSIRAEVPLVEGLTPYLRTGDVLGVATRALTALVGLLSLVGWGRRRRGVGPGNPGR